MVTRLRTGVVSSLVGFVIAAAALSAGAQPRGGQNAAIGRISVDGGATAPIYAFSFGAEQQVGDIGGGGGGAGKAVLEDVAIVKPADALSTALLRDLVTGRHLLNVRVELFGGNANQIASTFDLEDVIITRFQNEGDGAETVAFRYRIVRLTSGGSTICWDSAANQTC